MPIGQSVSERLGAVPEQGRRVGIDKPPDLPQVKEFFGLTLEGCMAALLVSTTL